MAASFDDFRQPDEPEDTGIPVDIDAILEARESSTRKKNTKFLGMTAAERAFLSFMLFLVALVLGAGLLIATNRVALPI
ncbi:MAG: hypothetical protein ACPG7F_09435 [Aggregatilineales bacterium]